MAILYLFHQFLKICCSYRVQAVRLTHAHLNLNKITVPQECNCINVHCRDIDHIEYIDKYVLDTLDTVEMASKEYLVNKDMVRTDAKRLYQDGMNTLLWLWIKPNSGLQYDSHQEDR